MCVSRFFFFKQKTAYELLISDWSSDVCSSDLVQRDRCVGQRSLACTCRTAWMREWPGRCEGDVAGPRRAVATTRQSRWSRLTNRTGLSAGPVPPGLAPLQETPFRGRSARTEEHPSELQSLMRL